MTTDLRDQARRDFLAYCQKCAELVATWPAWKRNCLSRPNPNEQEAMRWYWVVVTAELDGPPLAGVWSRGWTRSDAWHAVMHDLPRGYWDATQYADLTPAEAAQSGLPPDSAHGNRGPVFDFVAPCVIVDCRGTSPGN